MNEDFLKRKCVSWLRKNKSQEIWFYCPTDIFYSGIPDIIFTAYGFFGWCELKTAKGRVSPIQIYTHQKLLGVGASGRVVHGFEEFKGFVEEFLTRSRRRAKNGEW